MAIRNHIVPAFGSTALARLSAVQLQALYAAMLREGFAPATVAHAHAVIHKALKTALRLGHFTRNVADLVSAPSARKHQREMVSLTPEQAHTLLDAARGERLEALYVLAVSTGMRLGEMLALKWEAVDLDGAILDVRHTLHHEAAGAWRLTTPKTAKSRRRIDLPSLAVEALRAHRTRQLEERLRAGEGWEEHRFIFTRNDGEPLRGTHVLERHFRPLLRRAGLPAIRIHDLRHTAATLLLSEGVNIKAVSETMGHSDIAITLGIYGHLLPTMQKDVTRAMDRVLGARQARA